MIRRILFSSSSCPGRRSIDHEFLFALAYKKQKGRMYTRSIFGWLKMIVDDVMCIDCLGEEVMKRSKAEYDVLFFLFLSCSFTAFTKFRRTHTYYATT
jgi:hypothetical protein